MKTPFDSILEDTYEELEESKKDTLFIISYMDKIIVWLVGFSVVGITFIISNSRLINQTFSLSQNIVIICLLTLIVIFGIVFRVLNVYIILRFNRAFKELKSNTRNKKLMNIRRDIDKINDISQLIQFLSIDFGQDYSWKIQKPNITEEAELIKYLKEEHKRLKKFALNSSNEGIDYVKDLNVRILGIPEDELNKKRSTKIYYMMQLNDYIAKALLLSFIYVIIIIVINFISQ